MSGDVIPYVIALVMIGFCALSAFVLITTVNHFDAGHEPDSRERH